jgi:dihydroorotate dehydrogenase (fumarate)/dihydroorotate dehydrogenase
MTVGLCQAMGRVPVLPNLVGRSLIYEDPRLCGSAGGLRCDNPVGLGAGWDKNGRTLSLLPHLGFGFAEIGSVSARSSVGNPKPRLFRLPQDDGIIVNYGLPNDGAEVVASRMRRNPAGFPVGVNLVQTNDGPTAQHVDQQQMIADYVESATKLHRVSDFLTLNLSCPNASDGLDHFARAGTIHHLLHALQTVDLRVPVFLKVPPSPLPANIDRWITEAEPFPFVKGFIFNLPRGRRDQMGLVTPPGQLQSMPGAVAGRPIGALLDQCIREFCIRSPRGRFIVIGSGGIFTAEDAYRKIQLGASLLQIYTAMVYHGPGIVKVINQGLVERLTRDGFQNIQQAVGSLL